MTFTTSQSGFSLVEVLVSITILLLVIVGPLQIVSRSINSTNFATEQVNAWFLAQEGLELAQKGRDDLVLQNFKLQINPPGEASPMTKFLTDYAFCFSADGCGLEMGNGTTVLAPIRCITGNCRLNLTSSSDPDRSSYQHSLSGNTPTPYTRVIKMTESRVGGPLTNVREIKVTSTVTWRTGSLISSQKVVAETYLFNVYDTN